MLKTLELCLNLEPVAKGRPRYTRGGRAYTPKKTSAYERSIAKLVSSYPALLGPLEIEATFILKRPSRTPKSKRGRFIKAGSRGDLDNYVKALLDGLQRGKVIPNDAAVVRITAEKIYAALEETPHVEFKLRSIGDES